MVTKVLFIVNICYFVVAFVANVVSDYLSRRLLRKYGIPSADQGNLFVSMSLKGLFTSPRLSPADRRRAKLHYFIQVWVLLILVLLFVAMAIVFKIESNHPIA